MGETLKADAERQPPGVQGERERVSGYHESPCKREKF